MSDLLDLRSRALLIFNSTTHIQDATYNHKQGGKLKDIMASFIKCVDLAQEIFATFCTLKRLGHFNYQDLNATIDFLVTVCECCNSGFFLFIIGWHPSIVYPQYFVSGSVARVGQYSQSSSTIILFPHLYTCCTIACTSSIYQWQNPAGRNAFLACNTYVYQSTVKLCYSQTSFYRYIYIFV